MTFLHRHLAAQHKPGRCGDDPLAQDYSTADKWAYAPHFYAPIPLEAWGKWLATTGTMAWVASTVIIDLDKPSLISLERYILASSACLHSSPNSLYCGKLFIFPWSTKSTAVTMEKPTAIQLDDSSDRSPSDSEKKIGNDVHDDGLPPDPDAGLSAEERARIDKKLVRKLDLELIPWLCLLYLISFLDRKATIAQPSHP